MRPSEKSLLKHRIQQDFWAELKEKEQRCLPTDNSEMNMDKAGEIAHFP